MGMLQNSVVPAANRRGLSASTLKIIACVLMVIDHVGAYMLPHLDILRIIGRGSFPIFAYFMAEGCRYTRRKGKRLLLIVGMAVLCEGVYYLYSGALDGGIFITFTFSIILIYQVQAAKAAMAKGKWGDLALWVPALAASLVGIYGFIEHVLYISYGFWGVLIPVLTALPDYKEGEAPAFFAHLSNRPVKLAFFSAGLLILCAFRGLTNMQTYSLLAIPLLALYNGKVGVKGMKYGFYIFYPLHLIVIFLLDKLIH